MTADLHIVVTRETIILVRRADATFRDFQNRYPGFMTSIGPLDRDGVLDTFENEWPDILVINKNRIGAFLSSDTIPSETTRPL